MAIRSGKTKYPILFVHGVGFRDLRGINIYTKAGGMSLPLV